MAVKLVLTAEDYAKLPAEKKADYRAHDKDAKLFVLDGESEHGFEVALIDPIRRALERAKADHAEARAKIAEYGDIPPAKAKEYASKFSEIANWSPDQKVKEQIDATVKQVREKYEADLAAEKQRSELHRQAAEDAIVDQALTQVIVSKGGKPKLLLPALKQSVRAAWENGKCCAKVFSPDGKTPLLSRRGKAEDAMSLDEYIDLAKNDGELAAAFAGSGPGGAGSGSSGPSSATSSYRLSKADQSDPAKYRAAKEAAAKAGVTLTWDE